MTTQRRPAATPHVGHGTDDNCFVVSSFFPVENCPMTPYRKTIPFGTLLGTSRSPGESQLLLLLIKCATRIEPGTFRVYCRQTLPWDYFTLARHPDTISSR